MSGPLQREIERLEARVRELEKLLPRIVDAWLAHVTTDDLTHSDRDLLTLAGLAALVPANEETAE